MKKFIGEMSFDEFKEALKRREQTKAEAKARAEERQNAVPFNTASSIALL